MMRFNRSTMEYEPSWLLLADPEPEPAGDPEPSPDPEPEPTPEPADWRDVIEDKKLREHADRFTTPADLAKAHLDLRGKLSKAIIPPGKDASDEDIANYRKAAGIPESPEKYEWTLPDGHKETDADKAAVENVKSVFHTAGLTADQAKALNAWWNETQTKATEQQIEADKAYAAEAESALKKDWGKDHDANRIHANNGLAAVAERAGVDIERLKQLEMGNGRYLLDNPDMAKIMAIVGREMAEGSMTRDLTDDQKNSLADEVNEVREKRNKAMESGNHAEARRWDERERELYAKMGNSPVVGGSGRTA